MTSAACFCRHERIKLQGHLLEATFQCLAILVGKQRSYVIYLFLLMERSWLLVADQVQRPCISVLTIPTAIAVALWHFLLQKQALAQQSTI